MGALWLAGLLNYADRQAIFSIFPILQTELHLNLVELGLLGSAFAWAYGLAAPISGFLVDRVRRKSSIIAGLEFWSWICAATALASRVWSLVALRAAMGIGESLYFPASLSMLSDYHGSRTRSRALGLHQTSVYAGTIVGGFCAGWIADRFDWRWSFISFGLAGALLGGFLAKFLEEPARGAADLEEMSHDGRRPGFVDFLDIVWKTPGIWLQMAAFACANFVAVVLLVWMPSYLFGAFHMNLATSGLTATALAQTGSMAGTVVGGWLADRLAARYRCGRMMVQTAGVLLGAPFVYLSCKTHAMAGVLSSLCAWGFFKGLYDANIFAALYEVVPIRMRGVATGWMNTVGWMAGGGLAPLVVGALAGHLGLGSAMALVSGVYVVAGALLVGAGQRIRSQAGSQISQKI